MTDRLLSTLFYRFRIYLFLTIGEYFAQIFGFWSIIDQKYFFFLNRDFESFWPFWSNFFWYSSMPKNQNEKNSKFEAFFLKKGQNDSKFLLRKKKYFESILGYKIYFTPHNQPKIFFFITMIKKTAIIQLMFTNII